MPLNPPTELELAGRLGNALCKHGLLATTAESCTGGLVAAAITAIAGSSAWFDRSFVTYSNEAKMEMLGVSQALLDTHGAVSEPAARAMADGAIARSRAAVAVAITGIAGPGGATAGKPVGTVCFAWARRGGSTATETRHLPGDRAEVRRASVAIALRGLIGLVDSQ